MITLDYNGDKYGPYTLDEMKDFFENNTIRGDHLQDWLFKQEMLNAENG